MRKFYFLFALVCLFVSKANAQTAFEDYPPLYAVSPYEDSLYVIDTVSGFSRVNGIHLAGSGGEDITGSNGLAVHPCTGEIYGIFKVSAQTGRSLGIVDITTGTVTMIGNTGDNFAGIAFVNDTMLVGITGDGATVSESLFRIDLTTAATTLIVNSGGGNDGESIAYCSDNGLVYHWSGRDTNPYMSKMDPFGGTDVAVTRTGYNYDEIFGATYIGGGNFLLSNLDQEYIIVDTTGFATLLSSPVHEYQKGLAFPLRWVGISDSTSVCANDSATLVAFSGTAHQWLLNGSPISGATNDTLYVNQAGIYSCLVTINGCADTSDNSYDVTILNVPNVGITPTPNAYFCTPGDSVLLTGSSGGSSQWFLNGSVIAGATTNTLYVTTAGSYNMTKTNMNGCTDSSSVPTVVSLAPTNPVLSPAGPLTICFGDSLPINVTSGADEYHWFLDGTAIDTTTQDTLYITTAGDYTVETMHGTCLDTSNSVTAALNPEFIINPMGSTTICSGSSVTLNANPGGTGYMWLLDGNPIAGATMPSYMASQTGSYTCVFTLNGCTDTTTNSYSLTVVDCSGLDEEVANTISVYPNPASDIVLVSTALEGEWKLQVTDINGRVIELHNVSSNIFQLNVSHFEKGIYLLHISNASISITKQLIVK